jgi:DNA polymerase-3 subunit epsilon
MRGKFKLVAAIAATWLLLAVGIGLIGAAIWADLKPDEQEAIADIIPSRIGLVVFLTMIGFVLLGSLVSFLYRLYVGVPTRVAEELRLLLGANRQRRLQIDAPVELVSLVRAVNELADQRDALQHDVEEKIREARTSIEEERNRFAALMSELTQSVVVCNLDGRILLYNNRARLQFMALSEGVPTAGGGALIGLGRSIFAIFERNMITHALENIQRRLRRSGSQPVANFLTTTRAGQLLRVQMAPVLSAVQAADGEDGAESEPERSIGGYVMMLDNITRDFETESRRDQMLQSLTEGSRASLANVRAAIEAMLEYPDMDAAQRDRFVSIVGEEVRNMSHRLDKMMLDHADAMKTRWPLEEMLGDDLIAAAQRRIENKVGIATKTVSLEDGLWLKVDSFSLLQALNYLASRLHEDFGIREVRFRLASAGRLAHLDMIWSGMAAAMETLHEWELEPMNVGGETSLLTLRDVTERHGGEIWFQVDKPRQQEYFRLLIPVATPQETVASASLLHSDSRPEYYDFDLFRQLGSDHSLDERLLSELTFTVFDTETTGLQPAEGDEIIQIGAARIVNGRVLKSEIFDQLVDPRRPLNPESIPIHGITEDMLVDQPTIDKVLPAFSEFTEETVLVAHNAAFDMRFLQLKEESTGVRFTQPVLDTLLLSEVIHPNQESHKLEAIAERLGVNVIGRHTALGDAIVTGEVFLKMVPLLAEKGIRTLREARDAAEKTYYARVKY